MYKKIIWLGASLLITAAPFLRGAVWAWTIYAGIAIIGLLLFIWLWKLNNHNNYNFIHTPLDIPLFIFIIIAIISFSFSIYKYNSFYSLFRLIACVGIFYLIVNNYDYLMMLRTLNIVIYVGIILSIYGLLQYYNILPHPWWDKKYFLSSTYVNHSHFAGFLELVIPVTIGVMLQRNKNIFKKIFLFIGLLIMLSAFIFTQSRGAWISFIITLPIMYIVFLKRKMINKKTFLISCTVLILIICFLSIYSPLVRKRVDTFRTEDNSFQTRIKIWQGTYNMIKDKPITGVGIGNFSWRFPQERPKGLNYKAYFAHSDYLQLAAEMGIPAFIIIVWLLSIVVYKGLTNNNYPEIIGCTTGVLCLSLHGSIDFNFHIPANMLLFIVYIAFILKSNYLLKENNHA